MRADSEGLLRHEIGQPPGVAQRLKYPCSLPQLRFWMTECLRPGNTALNLPMQWLLDGQVSSNRLKKSLRMLIERHESLRTCLVEEEGEPIQIVEPSVPFALPVINLSRLSAGEAENEAKRIAHLEAQTPFDLAVAPLFRATLLQLPGRKAILLVTAHQSVADGWSMGVLARELGTVYAALQSGTAPDLPKLPHTYSDFAVWQRDWVNTPEVNGARGGVLREFSNAQYFELPRDRPARDSSSVASEIASTLVEREITSGLASYAGGEGCTLFMAALASLLIVLHRHTGRTDIIFGTQVAGREEIELEHLVGYFANTLVLRAELSGDPSFKELLCQVRHIVIAGFENQHLPYEKLIEFLRPRPDLTRNPLFSVNFTFQRAFIKQADHGVFRLRGIPSAPAGTLYDLHFFMVERPEGWRLSCEYKTELFRPETIDRLLRNMESTMRAAVSSPATPISAFPVLSCSSISQKQEEGPIIGGARAPVHRSAACFSRPLNEKERRLARIWAFLLGAEPQAPDANFFDLGGDSLLALRALRLVEQEFGCKAHFSSFFKYQTIEAFAAQLDDPSCADHSQVFELRGEGERPPILVINMIAPNRFYPLVQQLGSSQPVLGLQIFDPTSPETFTFAKYEEIAANYVRLIRKVQPKGPYALLGWCAGGVLTYAVAEQLAKAGEKIALLAIVDVWAPGYQRTLGRFRSKLVGLHYRWALLKQSIEEDLLRLRAGRIQLKEFFINRVPSRFRRVILPSPASVPSFRNDAVDYSSQLLDYLRRLARDYKPGIFSGKLLVFLSRTEAKRPLLEPARGWDRLARDGADLITLPGDHFTIFQEPGVKSMSSHIGAALDAFLAPSAER